jgi:prolyl-tRNA synthetase
MDREICSDRIFSFLSLTQNFLYDNAKERQNNDTINTTNYDEMTNILKDKGGFILANWCENEECENNIKNETGADIRLVKFEKLDSNGKCIYCNTDSEKTVIFAKAY